MKARARLVIVLIIILAAAAYWRQHQNGRREGGLVLYGNVDIREVEMAFRQPGRLTAVAVDEGDEVKPGDLLAELDARPYRDALAIAVAETERARAELAKLRRGNRPQEVRRAEEAVRQVEAVLARAEADWQRQSGLAEHGAASQKTLEAARAARDEAAASLVAAKEALSLQQEGFRTEDIAAAEAKLAAAEAARAQAETALADARLFSPAAATVSSRVREPGSMVGNRDAVCTLSLRDPLYVRAYVSEPELGQAAPGRKVAITTDSGRTYEGRIGFVSPRAEFTPKSVETTTLRTDLVYRLRIVVTNADDGLRQGMPVTVRLAGSDAARTSP